MISAVEKKTAGVTKTLLSNAKAKFEKLFPKHNFKWRNASFNKKRLTGLCPFHEEKHPSFNIFVFNNKTYYKCFACGKKGRIEYLGLPENSPKLKEYHKRIKNQDKLEKIRKIFKENFLNNEPAKEYVLKRVGIQSIEVKDFVNKIQDIGVVDINSIDKKLLEEISADIPQVKEFKHYTGWLCFFYRDIFGNITSVKLRNLERKKFYTIAFLDTKGFFSIYDLFSEDTAKFCYITEGEFNSIVLLANLYPMQDNVISIGSANNISDEIINYIRAVGLIPIICLDWDKAGKNALNNYIENTTLSNLDKVYCVPYSRLEPEKKDFADIFYKKRNIKEIQDIISTFYIESLADIKRRIKIEENANKTHIARYYPENLQKIIIKEYRDFLYYDKKIVLDTPKIRFYCSGLFPEGKLSLLVGNGGVGKTYIAIYLAIKFIIENKKPVFLWLSEDGGNVGYRVKQVLEHCYGLYEPTEHRPLPAEQFNLRNMILHNFYYDDVIPEPLLVKEYGNIKPNNKIFDYFKYLVSKYDLVFIDPLLSFYGYDESDNTMARRFMNILNQMIQYSNKSIVALHHLRKHFKKEIESEEDEIALVRGASEFVNSTRCVCMLKIPAENPKERIIKVIKSNVGNFGKQVKVRLNFLNTFTDDDEDYSDLFDDTMSGDYNQREDF